MTLWGWLSKNREKKDELCKISLNIALQRKVSHMPTYSSLRQDINWNVFTLAKYSGGKLTPLFFLFTVIALSVAELAPVSSLREKLWEISGEEKITVWLKKTCIWRVDLDNIRGSWKTTWVLVSAKKKRWGFCLTFSNENLIFVPVLCYTYDRLDSSPVTWTKW